MSTLSILTPMPAMKAIRRAHRKLARFTSGRRTTNENPYSLGGCIALLVIVGLIFSFWPSLQP